MLIGNEMKDSLTWLWPRMIALHGAQWQKRWGDDPMVTPWPIGLQGMTRRDVEQAYAAWAEAGDQWVPVPATFRATWRKQRGDGRPTPQPVLPEGDDGYVPIWDRQVREFTFHICAAKVFFRTMKQQGLPAPNIAPAQQDDEVDSWAEWFVAGLADPPSPLDEDARQQYRRHWHEEFDKAWPLEAVR